MTILLTGCTVMDMNVPPPVGWPVLEVVEREVDDIGVCDGGFGMLVLGCAFADFEAGKCDVYLVKDAPQWVREHERLHCDGYDHVGSDRVRTVFERWKGNTGSENSKKKNYYWPDMPVGG